METNTILTAFLLRIYPATQAKMAARRKHKIRKITFFGHGTHSPASLKYSLIVHSEQRGAG